LVKFKLTLVYLKVPQNLLLVFLVVVMERLLLVVVNPLLVEADTVTEKEVDDGKPVKL